MKIKPIIAGLLLATLLFSGTGAVPQAAQATPPLPEASLAPRLEGPAGARPSHTYALDTRGLADQVAAGGVLAVQATGGQWLHLLLEERPLLVEQSYVTVDDDGNAATKPFLGRTFRGRLLEEPASRAAILVAPEGLYGSVSTRTAVWSFQPAPQAGGDGLVQQEVTKRERGLDCGSTGATLLAAPTCAPQACTLGACLASSSDICAIPPPSSECLTESLLDPLCGEDGAETCALKKVWDLPVGIGESPEDAVSACGGSGQLLCRLTVQAFADRSYASYANDWYDRIVAAYNEGADMWESETGIWLALYPPIALSINFAQYRTCGKEDPKLDGGLSVFTSWVETDWRPEEERHGRFVGHNAYALFQAAFDMEDLVGCGNLKALSDSRKGIHEPRATSVVSARDWSWFDAYDPDDSPDLGMAASHELTHNAGETGHPTDGKCFPGTENIMNNKANWDCRDFWRAASTVSKVKVYSHPRLST